MFFPKLKNTHRFILRHLFINSKLYAHRDMHILCRFPRFILLLRIHMQIFISPRQLETVAKVDALGARYCCSNRSEKRESALNPAETSRLRSKLSLLRRKVLDDIFFAGNTIYCTLRMASDKTGKRPPVVELALASSVVNFAVRGIRCGIDNTTHGILSVMNVGCKRKVPKVTNELLLQPAVKLAAKIRRGELSSEELIKAYISRIDEVNSLVNAVVDNRYAGALEEGRLVDQLIRSGALSESQIAQDFPLLGVPFTAKEALLVKGLSSTCGLVCRKGMTAAEDCEPVQRLRSCGAIPIALTNTSEICMWWETYNKLHGRTNNPYDTTRTVGGSSGGEGALIGSAGSVIGLGTDLGGSIRIPAFFSGIFGHKPTQGIVPLGGQYPPALEEVQPYVAVGPMVRYAADLKLVLSALIGREETERLNLLSKVDIRTIKVYYMLDDGGAPAPSPVSLDIQEGIQKVVNMLSMEGLVVQKVNLKYLKLGFLIWCAYLSEVKKQRISNLMKGEVKAEDGDSLQIEMWKWFSGKSDHTFPIILNACAQDFLAPLCRKPLEFFIKCGTKMKQELLDILEPEPAVFLYPTFPHVAAHHGQILANPFNTVYSTAFNASALPVTQCPLGLSSGLPFGMQIVTAPNNDRLSIALAEHLEEKLGGWIEPS